MQTHTHTYTDNGHLYMYVCDARKHLFYLRQNEQIKNKSAIRRDCAGVAAAH